MPDRCTCQGQTLSAPQSWLPRALIAGAGDGQSTHFSSSIILREKNVWTAGALGVETMPRVLRSTKAGI